MTSERERFEAYIQRVMPARSRSTDADRQHYAAVKEHLWSGWQARAALPAPADQPQEPQGSSGSLSESGAEARTQVAASASGCVRIGDKVRTGVYVNGEWCQMQTGMVVAQSFDGSVSDVDIMSLHGGRPWVVKESTAQLRKISTMMSTDGGKDIPL